MGQMYNSGKSEILSGGLMAATIRVLLVGTGYTFNEAHDSVADAAAAELSGDGYERKTTANKQVALRLVDEGGPEEHTEAYFKFDNITYAQAQFGTIAKAIVYREGASDAQSPLITMLDPDDLVTNGGDVVLVVPDEGIIGLG